MRGINRGLGDSSGFSLIELLVVIAVIGILATIALPAYLGQKERAKSNAIRASAKGAEFELQSWLNAFVSNNPFLAVSAEGVHQCYESSEAGNVSLCSSMYPDFDNVDTYVYNDIDNLLDIAIEHYRGLSYKSPYKTDADLFTLDDKVSGTIYLEATGARTIRMVAYGENTDEPLYRALVSAR